MKSVDIKSSQPLSSETIDIPALLLQQISEKTTKILGTPRIIPIERKNVEKFLVDWWHIYMTKDSRWSEIIYFISPVYSWDNHAIHFYKNRVLKWKMMKKTRNDTSWENFIRERIEGNNFETWFEIPKTPVITSSPPDWAYYHSMRDNTIAEYVEKRRVLWECFFFKTYEEYLQLKREWFISEELVESKQYTIKVMYNDWKPDEYYTLTGLLSCEPTTLSHRPGKDNDRSIDTVLKAEGIIWWEILGIFPPSTSAENLA